MITPDQLRRAKRQHENCVDAVRNTVYENRAIFFPSAEQPMHRAASDLTYFHANAANVKPFTKVVSAFTEAYADQLIAAGAMETFKLRVEAARQSYDSIAKLVAEHKAQTAAKRVERAEREQLREQLGVDLQKIDEAATPETFRAIRSKLAAVEQHYERAIADSMHAAVRRISEGVANGQINTNNFRDSWRAFAWLVNFTYGASASIVIRDDFRSAIAERAKRDAAEIVAEFAAKLAGKVDREKAAGTSVVSASITTADLWNHSTLEVAMSDGSTQRWYTQMIWNTSSLGNAYRQWPTRRVG